MKGRNSKCEFCNHIRLDEKLQGRNQKITGKNWPQEKNWLLGIQPSHGRNWTVLVPISEHLETLSQKDENKTIFMILYNGLKKDRKY